MSCEYIANSTTLGKLLWPDVALTLAQNISCGDPSSIRPDVGGSPTPWPLTLISLFLHLHTIIVRIAKWENALAWSLVLAGFEIFVVLLAFISSHLTPEKVMVWSTIVQAVSAGAALQNFVLLVEEYRCCLPLIRCSGPDHIETDERDHRALNPLLRDLLSGPYQSHSSTESGMETGGAHKERHSKSISAYKISLMIAFIILFFFIIALQIRGLVAALEGRRNSKNLEVSWCSPVFNTLSIAVLDGNCRFHLVQQSGKKGVGCIRIPAQEQKAMFVVIIVLQSLFLVAAVFDFFILVAVSPRYRWKQVKMKMPWATLFSGVLSLLAVLAFGIVESFRLPSGITGNVWIIMRVQPLDRVFVCMATLTPAGLRGQLISWLDGLFSSWGSAYYGIG
ncbi:MAG: hypothetical protein M1840_006971 [Geoglossum simile]|nr:MAG: hypothetical protein M1840_006971 [Geoglossum simile]